MLSIKKKEQKKMRKQAEAVKISKEAAARKTLAGQVEAITLKDNAPEKYTKDTRSANIAEAIRGGYVLAVCVYTFAGSSWYQVAAE